MVKINEYLESGILEAYILGSASEAEARDLLYLKAQYPQVQEALDNLETDMELIAQHMAIKPPLETWMKIEAGINELLRAPNFDALTINKLPNEKSRDSKKRKASQFIDIESESNHMRIHKVWRWVFAAVFVLGKIFLAFAIYFYLENRSIQREIDQLRTEIKSQRNR